MNYHTNPNRKQIIAQALAARTLAEIEQAAQALREWVRDHPQDFGIRDSFELLSHRRDFLVAEAGLESSTPSRA